MLKTPLATVMRKFFKNCHSYGKSLFCTIILRFLKPTISTNASSGKFLLVVPRRGALFLEERWEPMRIEIADVRSPV
jgi:hypothetical protein